MSNVITKRIYYAIEVELVSPLCVSNGESQYTDSDVMRNKDGEAFVPGTSLAGAFRNALMLGKKEDGLMGYADGNAGRMSSLFISDLYFDEPAQVSVRDGIKRYADYDEKALQHVENKFDMEIVVPGVKGKIYMEIVFRQKDPKDREEKTHQSIVRLLYGIQDGTIRFGARRNRGFGRLKVCKVYYSTFTKEQLSEWLAFSQEKIPGYQTEKSYDEWLQDMANGKLPEPRYIKLTVPLELTGGISIRRYSTKPEQADYEHITCNGNPVIPGSSWNGAIRARSMEILLQAGCSVKRANELIDNWFGYVFIKDSNDSEQEKAMQSKIVIAESVLSADSKALTMTRNQVSRFDSSTIQGALYSEISYFGGETKLELWIRKEGDYQALYALLNYVIQDIQEGYVAVGGQVSVGRGVFRAHPDKPIICSEAMAQNAEASLYSLLYL